MEIGVEIAGLRKQHVPIGRERGRGGDQLEQIHRHRIGDGHLAGLRPDQPRDLGPDPLPARRSSHDRSSSG
jgi:hypothetical protein